jgi:CRP-like cAMP-binding protein
MSDRPYSIGELILSKGNISDAVYVIVRGKVRVELGEETFFLSDGDFFGEEGLFLNKPSPYNAISVEETLIHVLNEEEANRHIFKNPETSFTVFVKSFGKTWRDFKPFSESASRYVRILEEIIPFAGHADGEEQFVPAAISLEDLADKVQTSVENLVADITRASTFGHVKIKGGQKILTAGKGILQKKVYEYYRKQFFSETESRGSGLHTYLNLLKNENGFIFEDDKQ